LLIERWIADGKLPTLSMLFQHGMYGNLESSADVFSGSAWPAITSGCNPGKCGVYTRYQLTSGTYAVRRIGAADNRILPFWSSFKGPMVVIDVPKVPLSSRIDGAQVVEWGAYDHYAQFSAAPAHLSTSILKDFGEHPFLDRDFEMALHRRRDVSALKGVLINGIERKLSLNLHLMKTYQPRFFFSVFGECHAAGHAFWRFQDPRHPRYEPAAPMETGLCEVYEALDHALGKFLATLPPDCLFVALSSQGFCLDSLADEDFLCEVLIRMGMSVPLSKNTRYAAYVPAMVLDMARSKAFALPTDLQGYIRINLRGREPNGVVRESDYASVCRELETELLALRHRDTGASVVKNIVHVRDVLSKSPAADFPDLSVVWNTDQLVLDVESPTCGRIRRVPDLSAGCGNHRGAGFMLIYGSDFCRGRFNGNVCDVAPSLSRWLGEEIRPEWDGRAFEFVEPSGI
jgi:predicted AlkP superfamily phosphohydrolase/phosphomutase